MASSVIIYMPTAKTAPTTVATKARALSLPAAEAPFELPKGLIPALAAPTGTAPSDGEGEAELASGVGCTLKVGSTVSLETAR